MFVYPRQPILSNRRMVRLGLNDGDLQPHLVVSAAMLSDGVQVVMDPEVKPLEGTQSADTHIRQFIFDTRRHFREIIPCNKAIALKITERERQHPLSDTINLFFER